MPITATGDGQNAPPTLLSAEPLLQWRVHRVKQYPALLGPAAASTLFAAWLGTLIFHSPLAGLLATALIIAATAEFWLPVTNTITAKCVTSRCLLYNYEINWSAVRRCGVNSHGVLVSPLSEPSRLDVFRGVYLTFGRTKADSPEAVISAVRACFRPEYTEDD